MVGVPTDEVFCLDPSVAGTRSERNDCHDSLLQAVSLQDLLRSIDTAVEKARLRRTPKPNKLRVVLRVTSTATGRRYVARRFWLTPKPPLLAPSDACQISMDYSTERIYYKIMSVPNRENLQTDSLWLGMVWIHRSST